MGWGGRVSERVVGAELARSLGGWVGAWVGG